MQLSTDVRKGRQIHIDAERSEQRQASDQGDASPTNRHLSDPDWTSCTRHRVHRGDRTDIRSDLRNQRGRLGRGRDLRHLADGRDEVTAELGAQTARPPVSVPLNPRSPVVAYT